MVSALFKVLLAFAAFSGLAQAQAEVSGLEVLNGSYVLQTAIEGSCGSTLVVKTYSNCPIGYESPSTARENGVSVSGSANPVGEAICYINHGPWQKKDPLNGWPAFDRVEQTYDRRFNGQELRQLERVELYPWNRDDKASLKEAKTRILVLKAEGSSLQYSESSQIIRRGKVTVSSVRCSYSRN